MGIFKNPHLTTNKKTTMKDLFATPEKLPLNVKELIENTICESYADCDKLQKKLKKLGFTFDYGLDASPINLRKIKKP